MSLLSGPLLFKGGACPVENGSGITEAPSELYCAENRTMQDMTDNPRAFYEYLIQNKINENYQII